MASSRASAAPWATRPAPWTRLAADHETPNGNNQQIRTTWFDRANSKALTSTLDALLTDLT